MKVGAKVAVVGLLVTAVGGGWAWEAVNEYETECGRERAVEIRMDDVRATIDAQLDEAVGHVSVSAGFADAETDLAGLIDDVLRWAEADPSGGHREEILQRHEELLDDADDGVLDERLVAGLNGALRNLDRDVVVPLNADAAYDNAYNRTVTVGLISLGLWVAAFLAAITTDRRKVD